MKDWNRKQAEKQRMRALGQLPKKETKPDRGLNLDISNYPYGYQEGQWVSIEEAQAVERYNLMNHHTGDDLGKHWVNRNGDAVVFSY